MSAYVEMLVAVLSGEAGLPEGYEIAVWQHKDSFRLTLTADNLDVCDLVDTPQNWRILSGMAWAHKLAVEASHG